jgi:hypothetical protein
MRLLARPNAIGVMPIAKPDKRSTAFRVGSRTWRGAAERFLAKSAVCSGMHEGPLGVARLWQSTREPPTAVETVMRLQLG